MKCFLRLVCKTHSDLLIENCGVKILDHRMLLKRMNKRKVLFKGHATYHRLVWYHFILLGTIWFKFLEQKMYRKVWMGAVLFKGHAFGF